MRLGLRKCIVLIILCVTILALSSSVISCNAKNMNSQWVSEPIIVDGDVSDWMNARIALQEHEGTAFGITNDSNNIYLLVRSRDDKWVRTVRMSGLTLWFNGDGKHKYWAVKYCGGPSADQMAASMPTERSGGVGVSDDDRMDHMVDMLSRNENRFTVIDKFREIETDVSLDGSAGPSAAYSFSDGLYNYEFSIPLDYTDSLHGPRGLELGEKMLICAEWGGIQNGERRERPETSSGGMGGGRGGGKGGGRGMGGGRQPGSGRQSGIQPPIEIWIESKLAGPSQE